MCYEATDNSTSLSQLSYPGAFTHVSHRQHVEQAKSVRSTASVWCCRCSKQPTCDVVISHTPELSTYLFDNNNNIQHNVYGAVIMAEPLREFTRFIWWMKNDAKRPPTQAVSPPVQYRLPESTPTIVIYYYYSARKLIPILPYHGG